MQEDLLMSESLSKDTIISTLTNILTELENDKSTVKDVIVSLNKVVQLSQKDNPISFPQYADLSVDEAKTQVNKMIGLWNSFVRMNDPTLGNDQVDVNKRNLFEIVERVNKRKYHYYIYHNMSELSEVRETALLCFWIIKLKPFTVLNENSKLRDSANEYFSVYLILSILQFLTLRLGKEFEIPSDSFIKDTVYILKYREMSKEAMILFVSSIAQNYGITIDSWL